jgi:hypothetical protein
LAVSRDVNQEGNAKRTKCMIMYSNQRAGQKHDMTVVNKSLKNVEEEIYFGKTVTNQICISEYIK